MLLNYSKGGVSVAERLVSNGNLSIDEFCSWANIGRVTAYSHIKAGRLILTKIGRRSVITGSDALAYVAALKQPEAA